MENEHKDRHTEKFLDKMEEIFGVREFIIRNKLFELNITHLAGAKRLNLFIKALVYGKENKISIEGGILKNDLSILQEVKTIMDCLEFEYEQITNNEISIDEWKSIISTQLNEMGVKYEIEVFVIELEQMKKNILLLDNFIIYEKVNRPYDVRIFSYENLGQIIKMIEKEQRTINLGIMYGK